MDIGLFNPLTKNKISLPSAHTLPKFEFNSVDLNYRNYWFRVDGIDRVSLIRTPPDNELYVFVRYNYSHLAFARPGDSVWTGLNIEDEDERNSGTSSWWVIENIVGFNGEVLVLCDNGKLASLIKRDCFGVDQFVVPRTITNDTGNVGSNVYVPGSNDGPVSLLAAELDDSQVRRLHCLESFGDLLVVVEYMKKGWADSDFSEEFGTLRFEVFKLDSRGKKWAKLNDLGDVALFVAQYYTMAVRASDKCKSNCIYFIENKVLFPVSFKAYAMAVFDLSTDVIEEVNVGGDELYKSCSPFWLMPKLVQP